MSMLTLARYWRPRPEVGRIAFDFEALPVMLQEEPCLVWGRAIGTAHIVYDGHGVWTLAQLEISNPQAPGAPNVFVPVTSPIFAEVRERLDQYRGEDIGERIERDLSSGAHQRLFDEHRPHAQDRRGAPPHARRAPGAIVTAVLRLAGAGVELACIGLFLTGLWASVLGLTSGHTLRHPHPPAHVAILEMPEQRP